MTRYEKEIYDIVNSSSDHLTAEMIFKKIQTIFPDISRATVYNNLNKLCDQKLIRRISLENSPDRYDRVIKHDHLVCQKCGKLSDVSFEDLTESLKKQLGNDFIAYDLKVFYICPECQKKDVK